MASRLKRRFKGRVLNLWESSKGGLLFCIADIALRGYAPQLRENICETNYLLHFVLKVQALFCKAFISTKQVTCVRDDFLGFLQGTQVEKSNFEVIFFLLNPVL